MSVSERDTNSSSENSNSRSKNRKFARTPTIAFRLVPADDERFERLCRVEGKPKRDVARDAIRYYLDAREQNLLLDRDSKLDRNMQRGFDRLASMIARANIDLGVLYNMAFNTLPVETREKAMAAAYNNAVTRLRRKLPTAVQELNELIEK